MVRPSAQHYEMSTRAPSFEVLAASAALQPVSSSVVRTLDGVIVEIHVERAALAGTEGINPKLALSVEARATLGEISDALRDVFGEYRA